MVFQNNHLRKVTAMSNAVSVSYSKHSGKRVTDRFARNNPNYVETFLFIEGTVPVEFLKRGQTVPSNIVQARAADEARKAAAAKAEAEAAAKKATKAAKKVGKKAAAKKTVKKAAKKTSRVVKRDLSNGEFAKTTSKKKTVVGDVVKAPAKKATKKATKKKAVKKVLPASQTGLVN